jgi:hypothetical protein
MSNTQNLLSPIEQVFHNYGQRRTALDYAFFKLNLPEHDVALLVDFIVRRHTGIAQVRVSIHAHTGGGVSFAEIPLDRLVTGSMTTPDQGAHIGDNWLGAVGSRGTVGDTAWDLAFQPVGSVLYPQIKLIEPLHPFDLSLQSVPDVRFSGILRIAGQRYEVSEAHGMVSSYFGRALPERWFWISCNTFDREDIALECVVSRMALFGGPVHLKTGYFSVCTSGRSDTIIAPLNGSIRLEGTREALTITAQPRSGKAAYMLQCSASTRDYHDLGDRIHNTLIGSCTLTGIASANRSVGLEERMPGLI